MSSKVLSIVAALILAFMWAGAQDIDTRINDAKMNMINGNYEAGLTECKALIESGLSDSSKLSLVYSYAGISSEALGNPEDALTYYSQSVSLQVPQLDIYDKLISLAKKQKNDSIYEFALFEKAKAFPEYHRDITKSLAYHYANSKQYEKLLETSDQLLTWNPDNANYLFFKGVALQNLENIEEAKSHYRQVLEINPDHAGANMSLGTILYSEGSKIFAIRKKEYESKANPTRSDYSAYNKGIEEGKAIYREALPHLLKAYESGKYPGLKQILFNTYARLEQKDKAETYR